MEQFDTGTSEIAHLDRLEAEGVRAIHEASMHIIENVGIQLGHDRARDVVRAHGGEVHDDDVVTIPRDVIEDAVDAAPSQFTLHGRNPDRSLTVGGDGRPVRAPGYGPPNVYTYGSGRRRARLADYETLMKLAHVEDVINCSGYSVCEPVDVDRPTRHFEMLERSLTLSDQPVMASAHGETRAEECLDMVAIAVGDPDLSKPYVAGLVNTVPPRSIDAGMLGGLLAYADRGQPLVVSSFTMAGASGPETLPASMAQANAENLVGIALAQLVNPGTPVVYGVPSSTIDARHGSLSIGSPESALFAAVTAQMARYYGLPSRAGGGLTDAKRLDYQSGFESMLVQAVTDLAGVDYVLHAAGILESYDTVSPEKFVLDCEALRYIDRFREGFAIDADSFQLDRIAAVEPAGHFLDGTGIDGTGLDGAGAFYRPSVVTRRSYGDWVEDGEKSALELGRDRVRDQLDRYRKPHIDADVERDLREYVQNRQRAAR